MILFFSLFISSVLFLKRRSFSKKKIKTSINILNQRVIMLVLLEFLNLNIISILNQ